MASLKFPNYLIKNRKRLGLSQDEVAFLLGARGGAKVSRYERFTRAPNLETILAFEAVYQRPVSELFAGLYKKIEKDVAARAKVLTYRTDLKKPGRRAAHKLQVFTNIALRQNQITAKQPCTQSTTNVF